MENISILPKSAKENRTKSGKRRPMTFEQSLMLRNVKFNLKSFQRIAQRYYRTNSVGNKLWVYNEITEDCIIINFISDTFGYIKISCIKNGKNSFDVEIPKPRYNSCLFKKILSKKLL